MKARTFRWSPNKWININFNQTINRFYWVIITFCFHKFIITFLFSLIFDINAIYFSMAQLHWSNNFNMEKAQCFLRSTRFHGCLTFLLSCHSSTFNRERERENEKCKQNMWNKSDSLSNYLALVRIEQRNNCVAKWNNFFVLFLSSSFSLICD